MHAITTTTISQNIQVHWCRYYVKLSLVQKGQFQTHSILFSLPQACFMNLYCFLFWLRDNVYFIVIYMTSPTLLSVDRKGRETYACPVGLYCSAFNKCFTVLFKPWELWLRHCLYFLAFWERKFGLYVSGVIHVKNFPFRSGSVITICNPESQKKN